MLAYGNYAKIWTPAGIILRRQRVESWGKYLWRRLPICAVPLFMLYSLKIYHMNYMIDFYSVEEDINKKKLNI